MSAQAARPAERGYHQDYIARIRYENTLPPPPGAPKLLNIPTEGLNYYTSAAFGSRLARQQPLNIEADAELGMSIDLVGMPGIFDGDESCKYQCLARYGKWVIALVNTSLSAIQAPLAIPPIHPKDKNLLRPVSELGKPKFSTGGHSFLRRTEYISSDAKARAEANASTVRAGAKPPTQRLRKHSDASKDDPIHIMRNIVKGFDIVNPGDEYPGPESGTSLKGATPSAAELEAWRRPKHPTKSKRKLVDSYLIKPDLEAFPDTGFYYVFNYNSNPTSSVQSHDTRVDAGLIHPAETMSGGTNFELYLPEDAEEATNVQRQLDTTDPDRDDPSLRKTVNREDVASSRFNFHRVFDVKREQGMLDKPYKEVALALHDPKLGRKAGHDHRVDDYEKAAFYYPIGVKLQFKPRRAKNLELVGLASKTRDESKEKYDAWDIVIRDADDNELERRETHREELQPGRAAEGGSQWEAQA